MAKKIKHSKVKNTGVLFELLVRQITNDTLNGIEKSNALNIVKEFFGKNTTLKKELKLYNTILKEKFETTEKAEKFLDIVLVERKKLNNSTIKRQKYNLIKEIRKHYDLDNFFRTKISNYKLNASIYKLFESHTNLGVNDPKVVLLSKDTIVEHISSVVLKNSQESIIKEYSKQDKSIRLMGQKILLEKFNEKYGKALNSSQSSLVKKYINNISNTGVLSKHLNLEAITSRKKIVSFANKVDDKITSIKLKEVAHQLRKIEKSKTVNESYLSTMMTVYELLEEFRNVN